MLKQILVASLLLTAGLESFTLFAQDKKPVLPASTLYKAKDYSQLLGMSGFSDELLKMHFQLYEGYVKNTNLLMTSLKEAKGYDFGALKRRFAWEFDGMRLHEFYFDNLGGDGKLDLSSSLFQKMVEDFGSYEAWKTDFINTGLMRGIGWVVLTTDPMTGHLFNVWINEHDLGHLAGAPPLLVMDVFEHAYMPQYGLDRAKYIQAFFQNIQWDAVKQRYNE
jgi:Fe-Mn family superoxide dismutase